MPRFSLCVLLAALSAGCAVLHKAQDQTVTASEPLKRIAVAVDYRGGAFYHVKVRNTLPSGVRLLWDESTYVTTDGKSVRLIRVDGPHSVPEYAPARQAASAIAAGTEFETDFTGEEWLDCARRNCTPQARNREGRARIVLAFETGGKRTRWQGDVVFTPPEPREPSKR